jgi:trk system potassium uptake protein TrkH
LDFRPVFLVVGVLLGTRSFGMCLPAALDAVKGNPDWPVFAVAAGVTMFAVRILLTPGSGRG